MSNGHVTRISEKGLAWLAKLEGGHRLKAYLCPAGVPTIGAGLTRYSFPNGPRVKLGDTLPDVMASLHLLSTAIGYFEKAVDALSPDDIPQHQFDAITSWTYTLGPQGVQASTLLRLLNSKPRASVEKIAAQFPLWIYSNGKKLEGLRLRRLCEALVFTSGEYLDQGEMRRRIA